VSKTFIDRKQRVPVLDPVSLDVAEGEFLAVVGSSGAGKTTLLNIAAALVSTDTGEVRVDGRVVTEPGPDRGVIFQQYAVFPWLTVRKNIEFGMRLRHSRRNRGDAREVADSYIRLMGLEAFENAYPKTLSGGMRQRVALARAYAADPEILLMDEPFGALDAQTRDRMQVLLQQILAQDRRSVMFITHSVEEALFLGNRVAILGGRPGRLLNVVDVPFEHPRDPEIRMSPEFGRLRAEIERSLNS
jgi:NitT/TauT family transport system ATP-binding protein